MDMTTIIYVLFLLAIVILFYMRMAPAKGLRTLRTDAFQTELRDAKNGILIDVREPAEFHSGHIPGAVNIPLSQLGSKTDSISKDRNVYLYCRSGMRSKQAARVLRGQGYANLAHLQGGISGWNGQVKR